MKKILIYLLIVICLINISSCSKSNNNLKMIDIDLTSEEYAYAVKKGNDELRNEFNLFLDQIKLNGELNEIIEMYFSSNNNLTGYNLSTSNVTNTDDNFVVATNCPFEPFEYVDGGKVYGIDIEIAARFAKAKNLELIIKNIDFDAVLSDVNAGFSDIGMAGMSITLDRLKVCDFTNPYYQASQKLIVKESNKLFDNCNTVLDIEQTINNEKDIKIGYQFGTTANWYVIGDESLGFNGFKDAKQMGYKTSQLALIDLQNNIIDCVIVDEAPGTIMISGLNQNDSKIDIFINSISQENFQKLILTGLRNTIIIAVTGLLIGIIIGTLIALLKVAPKYKLIVRILDKIGTFYVAVFRGTPMVVQLLIAYYVLIPLFNITSVSSLFVAIVVFGLNSAAYVSEIMRGGINAVDKGQLEAGRALGLSYPATMVKIVIPQAIKNILPTLGNELITLIKETSVVSFITVVDLYTAFNTIGTNTYSVIIPYLVMAVIYILLVVIISIIIKLVERRLTRSDRRN